MYKRQVPGLTGDGTKENPYNIATASLKQDGSVAWVQGYIVGSADGASLADGSKFEAPFVGASNILIADDVNEKDYKKCIPVQLVAGTDLRAQLNLVDNAANLGQVVIIKGTLENYFKQAGVKAPTAAVLNGKEIGDGGEPTPGNVKMCIRDSFKVSHHGLYKSVGPTSAGFRLAPSATAILLSIGSSFISLSLIHIWLLRRVILCRGISVVLAGVLSGFVFGMIKVI